MSQQDLDETFRALAAVHAVIARDLAANPFVVGKVSVPAQKAELERALADMRTTGFCVTSVENDVEVMHLAATGTSVARELELALLKKLAAHFGAENPATN